MAESTNHIALLTKLVSYVQHRFNTAKCLSVLHDLPGPIGADKPPSIGGYRPDLYAEDPISKTLIIGEAKTSADLETDHSKQQYRAFARFLATSPRSTLILAVPWPLRARAETLLKIATEETSANSVVRIVIHEHQEISE